MFLFLFSVACPFLYRVCLSVYLSNCLALALSVYLSLCFSLPVYLCTCISLLPSRREEAVALRGLGRVVRSENGRLSLETRDSVNPGPLISWREVLVAVAPHKVTRPGTPSYRFVYSHLGKAV